MVYSCFPFPLGTFRSRSRSRSLNRESGDSVEHSFGVSKQTLLHGSYSDYIKEYAARTSCKGSGNSGQVVVVCIRFYSVKINPKCPGEKMVQIILSRCYICIIIA